MVRINEIQAKHIVHFFAHTTLEQIAHLKAIGFTRHIALWCDRCRFYVALQDLDFESAKLVDETVYNGGQVKTVIDMETKRIGETKK